MRKRPAESDAEVLPDQVATRLLTRASELDAAQRASANVAELRTAATEAGISPAAFDAALAELQQEQAPAVIQPTRRSRLQLVIVVMATVIAISALYVSRRVVPTVAIAPTIEQTFQLRCLTGAEAAELLRPVLNLPTNSIQVAPERAPRVLTVRATPEQMQTVRSVLDLNDGAGAPACATRPAPPATR